jgi:hypothetical protein
MLTGRLDDDFALHVRVDRAQIAVVARGRKRVKEKLSSLTRVFDRNPLLKSTTVCGMFSLLTQVTVVPGATVISLGMKVLWSIFTVATGPVLAFFVSSARHDVDARPANRAVNLRARRTLCGLHLSIPGYIFGFATKRIRSRIFKTTLLFVNLARALPLTGDSLSRDEIPDSAHIF